MVKQKVHIMLKKMSKFCPLRNKNKRKSFVRMKTSDFILQGRKPKLLIKVGNENIFYPIKNHEVEQPYNNLYLC
jgi:hypothetical protein